MKLMNEYPEIIIMPEILNKIRKYTNLCDHSVYWMGKVIKEENRYYIEDAMLLMQTVGKKGEIDLDFLLEAETLIAEEGYTTYCLGRTKRNKSVQMQESDMNFLELLVGQVGEVIYIQTNTKGAISANLLDYDKGIIFDDIELTIKDTEFFSDEEILDEISVTIANSKIKTLPVTKTSEKIVEILKPSDKEDNVLEKIQETGRTIIEKAKEIEKEVVAIVEKPEYIPNQFVTDNIHFSELVGLGGDVNEQVS